ncbi:conserved hypothetical protein [Trichophyton verrucosum HKI 0517]|uniref:Uncharacterized protein n=1 Tax=Trichophyton verrucosum (strain HKI 0517) TaxID=663202 RepID=D4DI56_TRIVH|nr:uncharacterized protein TRV_06864 [Trichophyton verrucosum HKI 0517]EFE38464.1 conserved hypothetical protein [Trichophyton verrucosum HKI 0517]
MHLFGGQRSKRDTAEKKKKKKKKRKKKAAGVAYRERGDKKGPKRRWLDAVRKERQRQRAVKEESSCRVGEGHQEPQQSSEKASSELEGMEAEKKRLTCDCLTELVGFIVNSEDGEEASLSLAMVSQATPQGRQTRQTDKITRQTVNPQARSDDGSGQQDRHIDKQVAHRSLPHSLAGSEKKQRAVNAQLSLPSHLASMDEKTGDKHEKQQKQPQSADRPSSGSTSMADRIQSSAAGLLKSAITPSASTPAGSYAFARDVSSSLAGVSSSEKAGGASSSSSSAARPGAAVEGGIHHGSSSTQPGSALRSLPSQGMQSSLVDQEREFQQGGLPVDGDTADGAGTGYISTSTTSSKGKGREVDMGDEQFDSAWKSASSNATPSAVTEQERRDGQAVSDLLSSATFDPSSLPDTDPDELQPEPEPDMSFLTTNQRGEQQPDISSTSLIPDIDFVLSSLRGIPPQSQVEHLRDLPGVAEWLDLDREYQDVVWGSLKPAVEEARQEVQEKLEKGEQGAAVGDGPAVARLRMVLAHLKEKKSI